MKESINYLKNKLNYGDTVVVACSGGPDSMCLLSLLMDLKKEKDLEIIVAHVNHQTRIETANEEEFVKNYCLNNNLKCEVLTLNEFKNNKFSESKAHQLRHNFFKEVAIKYRAKYIISAHHGDDLIETILMRITRGSNLKGYSGFLKENDQYLKPLIYASKDEIIKYNQNNNINYVIDESNNNLIYTRNRYRHKIIPFLKSEEKNIHKKFLKYSQELYEYDSFIKKYVENLKVINNNIIYIDKIKNEDKFIQRKVIEQVIENIQKKDMLDVSTKQIEEILKLLEGNNRSIDLQNDYKAIKDYNELIITKEKVKKEFSYEFNCDIITKQWKLVYVDQREENENVICLDSSELKLPLVVRNRQDGDRILTEKGIKKVKDIFIDMKIDRKQRDEIPLVVDSDNNILWIAGIKKSKFTKNNDKKYDIIIKYEARRIKDECKS